VEDEAGARCKPGPQSFLTAGQRDIYCRIESLAAQVEELAAEDGVEVFILHGEFDAYSMPMLGDRLDHAIDGGHYDVVIDMCDVSFVDLSTLNRIVRAMKEVYRHNGHLVVACAQRNVLRAIDLAGLRHAVKVYETREDALNAVRTNAR
jgi:anti-anti-sigma factor